MPSKNNKIVALNILDLYKWIKQFSDSGFKTEITVFSFPDSYIEKCFLDILKKRISYNYFSSAELNNDWLRNELLNPSLFSVGVKETYLLGRAEVLKKESLEFIGDLDFSNLEHNLILTFNGLDKKMTTLSKSEKEISFYRIDLPKFWESEQLLHFFSEHLDIKLSSAAFSFLANTLEFKSQIFYQTLEKLKHLLPVQGVEISLEYCKEIIIGSKLDQFDLADIFSNKRRKDFYRKICSTELDMDWFRSFCGFMQGHLFKILDTSYTLSKSKLSKYDQKIINYSSSWKDEDLLFEMRRFGEFEILAKRKDPFLFHRLKRLSF